MRYSHTIQFKKDRNLLQQKANSALSKFISETDINKLKGKQLRKYRKKFNKEKRPNRDRNNPKQYRTYINSSLWTQRKNKYWQLHKRQCAVCDSFERINLHHAYYNKDSFGTEPDCHLFPFCQTHHKMYHDEYGVKKNMIKTTKEFILENRIWNELDDRNKFLTSLWKK